MRFPIKLNQAHWPSFITRILPSAVDPRILTRGVTNVDEFTNAVSVFKFGKTFKSTRKTRFPLTIDLLKKLHFAHMPVILDVGASDGTTSLDVMQALNFQKYFVTDLNLEVTYNTQGKKTWFFDDTGNCILMVSDHWVMYPDFANAIFPFNLIANHIFLSSPKNNLAPNKILLINPKINQKIGSNVIVKKYSIFDRWEGPKIDLLIAANILNRSYFTDNEIKQALKTLTSALQDGGIIAIIDNRQEEKSTIFQVFNGSIHKIHQVNGGSEIANLLHDICRQTEVKPGSKIDAGII